ncbi:MAG: NADH-quinone oxidoreductase subunit C, partial [Ancrocorticia sp.]|nr:NADH-quinone oxidoreductase subunit C [Ancrocorticia sp.]
MSENNEGALTPGSPQPSVLREVKGMWGVRGSGDTSGFAGLEHTEVMARPASRPYGGWFDEVVDVLIELFQAEGI